MKDLKSVMTGMGAALADGTYGLVAGLGLGTVNTNFLSAIILVLGIIIGSATWWFMLSGGITFILHHRMTINTLRYINRISGSILIIFGIFAMKVW